MCIIVSSCFWHSLSRIEPPYFHIFTFITLVARACYCAAQISDSVSNGKCAECNHLCPPSISTDASLACFPKNFPCISMLSNPLLWYSLISLVVPPLFTTWAHGISPCTGCPLATFTIWNNVSSDLSTYCANFVHSCRWVSTNPTSPRPPSRRDKQILWTSYCSCWNFAFASTFRVLVSSPRSSACVQCSTPNP